MMGGTGTHSVAPLDEGGTKRVVWLDWWKGSEWREAPIESMRPTLNESAETVSELGS